MGGVLVMGRKTYESIGRPLPGRETVVVSRSGLQFEETRTVRDLEDLGAETFGGKEVFIAGGAEIYAQALPRCSSLFLSVIRLEPEGDAFFPQFEDGFVLVERVMEHPEFEVFHYAKK